jgi:hypothetical protein
VAKVRALEVSSDIQQIPYERLKPGPNPRRFFPGLVELAGRIEKSGKVDPLTVLPDGSILSGERRWRSCGLLNENARKAGQPIPWPTLPVLVDAYNEKANRDWAVNANLGRVDFRFIELAHIFEDYRTQVGLSDKEIAETTGYDVDTVGRYVRILEKTHPDIISRLENGEQFPIELLIKIHTIPDKEVQKLRLEQWLGNPAPESETAKQRERRPVLSRRKMVALVKLLQEQGAAEETVAVAQFITGMRQTLPHKWHLRLSRRPRQQATE